MLPLGNRGSNNLNSGHPNSKGMQTLCWLVYVTVFFSGENSVIVDLALGLSQQAPEHGCDIGLPEFSVVWTHIHRQK